MNKIEVKIYKHFVFLTYIYLFLYDIYDSKNHI